jgi:hypothetical protein
MKAWLGSFVNQKLRFIGCSSQALPGASPLRISASCVAPSAPPCGRRRRPGKHLQRHLALVGHLCPLLHQREPGCSAAKDLEGAGIATEDAAARCALEVLIYTLCGEGAGGGGGARASLRRHAMSRCAFRTSTRFRRCDGMQNACQPCSTQRLPAVQCRDPVTLASLQIPGIPNPAACSPARPP